MSGCLWGSWHKFDEKTKESLRRFLKTMETPKASIIPEPISDCPGTHVIQTELDELSKRAEESSLWEERFHNAAQSNARLEKEKEDLFVFCKRMFVFIEHLEHREKCQSGVLPCLNCQAGFVAEDWRNRR